MPKKMEKTSKVLNIILYVSLLAFVGFVVYILYLNQEVFYTAHDRSEFIFGTPFFHTLMSKPFGLMRYVGAWLTQLFVEPELGSAVLVAIWLLIFCVGAKAFRLQGSASALMLLPVACLLTSMVDLGYWVYISPVRGYWFSQSVGYLAMLLLLWAARSTPRKWHLAWYLLGVCTYPVLGWFALLFVVCLILFGKPSWRELLGIILLIVITSICHTQLYSYLRDDDVVMAGFPRFVTPIDNSPHLSLPFWVLGAVTVLIALIQKIVGRGKWLENSSATVYSLTSILLPLTSCLAGIIFTSSLMYYDKNYIDEMRMVRLACNDNWKGVLQLAEEFATPHSDHGSENKTPTNTMIFLKNVALMNEGGLLERSFKLGSDGADLNNPDSLHVSLLDIASPLVYYNYGMMNESIRLSYENAIQAGFSPFYLKMLARCALACGDKKLQERYTTLIHKMPFYGDWQPAPVTKNVKELMTCYPDELTGVENSESYLISNISLWYGADSKVASEQALFYAMLRSDSRRYWPAVRKYVKMHLDEEFPLHAQEAYILFMDKAPEEKRIMLPVKQDTYDRYKQFWSVLEEQAKTTKNVAKIGEAMRPEWGDTYWWYNIFAKKIY